MCYLNRGSTFYFRFIIIKGIGVRPIPFCTYLSMYFTRASFKLFSHCFFPFNVFFSALCFQFITILFCISMKHLKVFYA